MARPRESCCPVNLNLSEQLLVKVDELAERRSSRHVRVSRSAIVRELLELGLLRNGEGKATP